MRPFAAKRAEARLSLQEELIVAIHGAFEVAVEIAVQEVTKLVGQLTGDGYEELRRENECLKRRLQRAEALLDAVEGEGDACLQQRSPGPTAGIVHGRTGVKGDAPAPVERPHDPQHKPRAPEQRPGGDVETQHGGDSASDPQRGYGGADGDAQSAGVREEMTRVCARTKDTIQPRQDLASNSKDLPLVPGKDDKPSVEPVTVKQESADEDTDDQDCCLDSIKLEDFSLECMSEVQSKMLEEWKPEVFDVHRQDSVSSLTCTGQSEAHPSDVASALPPPTHPPSAFSDFPNIFQLAESAPTPAEAPPQVYGVQVRTGRTPSHCYACKHCGQMFHLPSLLRRHSGQCQQRAQQRVPQPAMGSRRSRLQLYPPGCSPFRCTVCNREFNRMENLKTHLRIHTGERPYTCSVCAKCFRHSGALTRHFRIHTGEKPYVCAHCGKSFRNCGGLKFHQRSHNQQT